jgi:hypothetical protein
MKTLSTLLTCTLLSAAVLNAQAQQTTTTTTTNNGDGTITRSTSTTYGNGTISEYVPGSTFVVKETTGPVTYRYGKKVTYENKHGKVISETELPTRVKVGTPVQVYYDMDGNARVVNRVIINDD